MAELLIRTVDGHNLHKYMDGDVVCVVPDGHQWGRLESLEVWIAEGRDPVAWPGGFVIARMTGLSVEDAQALLAEDSSLVAITWDDPSDPSIPVVKTTMARRRSKTMNYRSLERRTPSSGRDTLYTHKAITRIWPEVSIAVSNKMPVV